MSIASQLQAAWLGRGPLARMLVPLSCLHALLLGLRSQLFKKGLLRTPPLPVPVIVVGNLVAGGAGKTPTTIALVELLRRHGLVTGIISRGYGRASTQLMHVERTSPATAVGDEPLLMHLRTGAPVVVGADRVAAARELLRVAPGVNVLLSDDGLQHRRLPRSVQVIVFDERGAGNGWLLPAGPLREPMPARIPPRSLVLYNAPVPSTPWPGHLAVAKLAGLTPLPDWWAGKPARDDALDQLAGKPVIAAAGLARPTRFFDMLRAAGLNIRELPLPDHHDFATLPWPDGAEVVVTEKDAVKLKPDATGKARVWVATLDFALGPAFAAELMQWFKPPPAPHEN